VPWNCCDAELPDSAPVCPTCGKSKEKWTVRYGVTRRLQIGKARWVEIRLLDPDGQEVAGEPYKIVLPTGKTIEGTLDDTGQAKVDLGRKVDTCQVIFPERDVSAFAPPPVEATPLEAGPAFASVEGAEVGWVEIVLRDGESPVANEPYVVELPDGSIREGVLDSAGIALVEMLPPGKVKVRFPERDATAFTAATLEVPADSGQLEPVRMAAVETAWVEIVLREGEASVPFEPFVLELADGTTRGGTLDARGQAVVDCLPPGKVKVRFPERDASALAELSEKRTA